jgi:hypothetical protein
MVPSIPARMLYVFFHSGVCCLARVAASNSCPSRGSMINLLEFLSPFFVQSCFTAQFLQSVRENFVDMVMRPVLRVFNHHPVLRFPCGQVENWRFPIDLEGGEVIAL